MMNEPQPIPVYLSIGIMAWNEEDSIRTTLESLFQQSLFEKLGRRHVQCEILCLANGCTDRTVAVAEEVFVRMKQDHPQSSAFTARAVDIPEPGRNNAWNLFVHEFSAPATKFIYLMDADIVFHHRDTLYNMMATLERTPSARVASDQQYKDLYFKEKKSLRERISLATSNLTGTIEGRFSGQLYCVRADTARNVFLPRDLGATDDGFLKAVICTDFLTRPIDPSRIVTAPNAAHVYEAYVSIRDVLNNQKRQMIGQTTVHVLLEYLKGLPTDERASLARTLEQHDQRDPDWLKKLIDEHMRATRFFWQLFPGLLTFRFRRLGRLPGWKKLTHLPATLAGFAVTMIACWRARRFLQTGMAQYWPKVSRQTRLKASHLGAK